MVVFLFFRFLSIFHKISGFAEFRTFIIRLWTGEIAWKMSELWSFFFFFQFLSTFHQVFRVLPLEKLNSLLNSKYFRLWMGEIAWKTSELCYFFCLIFQFFSTFHQIFRVWDWWNRMKNERVTVNIQIIKFWKNCNNKFIDPEEREKWTSLFTPKNKKNEQVYWWWRDRKMNKFIDPERQKNEQVYWS